MIPFDSKQAKHGQVVHGIDPASLHANRPELEESRIENQRQLIVSGTPRYTIVVVNCEGVILQGNHGVRAAAEMGVAIDVQILDFPHPSFGFILDVPVVKR